MHEEWECYLFLGCDGQIRSDFMSNRLEVLCCPYIVGGGGGGGGFTKLNIYYSPWKYTL